MRPKLRLGENLSPTSKSDRTASQTSFATIGHRRMEDGMKAKLVMITMMLTGPMAIAGDCQAQTTQQHGTLAVKDIRIPRLSFRSTASRM